MEHTDLGGSFVKPQNAKDVEVALEMCPHRGPVLSVSLKPRPVSLLHHLQLWTDSPCQLAGR